MLFILFIVMHKLPFLVRYMEHDNHLYLEISAAMHDGPTCLYKRPKFLEICVKLLVQEQ